ncbi:hypothetical protein K0M31_011062 [Melipona bicolor]|uniref:Uncharacterized protein n=1 Tax=Melipona bicolor TaxID=60889 RepID=A0AA40FKU3_9HYME|nr:hypothetical protein K0M31_011062 [Melipona bicolor]
MNLRSYEWVSQQIIFFAGLTYMGECKILFAKIKDYKERTFTCGSSQREGALIPCIELYNKGENWMYSIGKEMINEGFAEPEGILSSTDDDDSSLRDEIGSPNPVSTSPKSILSSEMSAKTTDKLDSPDSSFMSLETKSSIPCRTSSPSVEEINNDLITPQKPVKLIEEIDLVTPAKDEANRFIENEKEIKHENVNGRDDCYQNEAGNQSGKPRIRMPIDKFAQIAPAGYESDLSDASDASDDLTLG